MSCPAAGNDAPALCTDRLTLRLITPDDVAAVLARERRDEWAEDFPSPGDLEIAGLLSRIGVPTGPTGAFGHRLVIERSRGLVVGGVGFFGPPDDGRVEIGYGIVGSRRGRGYATEAAARMVELAAELPGVDRVIATVESHNVASIRVLEKVGMTPVARRGTELTYQRSLSR